MRVSETELPGVLHIEPKVFGDERGFFLETYQSERYAKAGISEQFVQDNVSLSARGVLRGLHFQNPFPQGKLVTVLMGEVFDVAVDIRVGSPTFGRWTGALLSSDSKNQLWVPPGFAHGFCVTSETALFAYKCTELYHPEAEVSVLWNDPDIGIHWPASLTPALSPKDADARQLRDLPRESLFVFEG